MSHTRPNIRLVRACFVMVLMLFTAFAHAATETDFITVETTTLRLYNEKKWDSLIITGKSALRNDIDYFFLRLRLGFAYFEKGQYFPASDHFRKAVQFNSTDPTATSMLYYAYLYSNRKEEAVSVLSNLSPEAREKIEEHAPVVEHATIAGGYTFSSDEALKTNPELMGSDSLYGEEDLYGDNLYTSASAKFNLTNRISLTAAYTYLNFNKTRYIQYTSMEDRLEKIADSSWGKNYIWSFNLETYDTNFRYRVSQHEAYLGATVVLPQGFRIMPAFHLVNVGYTRVDVSQEFVTVADTGYYVSYDSSWHTFDFVRTRYRFTQKDTSFNNYLVSLMVTKDFGIFNAGLTGSWSNLNGGTQYQAGLSLTYYPLGNLDFYGTTTATGFFAKRDKRLLLSQVLGAKITPWCWAEGNFYYGDFTNANIANGAIVYNNSDLINFRAGARALFLVGKHLRLSLIYQYFSKESYQVYYIRSLDPETQEPSSEQKTTTNPYHTHSIIGEITWKL